MKARKLSPELSGAISRLSRELGGLNDLALAARISKADRKELLKWRGVGPKVAPQLVRWARKFWL